MDWQSSFALANSSRRAALRTCRLRHSQHLPQVSQLRERANDEAHGSHGNSDEFSADKKTMTKRKKNNKKKKAANSELPHAKGIIPAPRRGRNKTTIGRETPTPATFVGGKLPALLNAEFFQCDALELAPKLLGKLLRRDDVVLQITEVEAYRPNDSACHGRFGITSRTAPVFGPGGHAYVYLCYGLHIMLNIVADLEGVGAAVLIRSCAPVAGIETIQSRRGMMSVKPELLNGPGKIGQALGLTTEWSNHPLYMPGGLEVLDGQRADDILIGPRVGIDYANPEDVAAQWRFAISGTPWISAPKNTLSPAPI